VRPARPFRLPGLAGGLERLRRLLALGLSAADWTCPPAPAILNLACGRADESGVVLETLAPRATRGLYLGIDLRAPEIDEARARWLPAAPPGWDLEFRCGDASQPERLRQLPPIDFALVRHQNFWNEPDTWTRLFAGALKRLAPRGLLAITSYFDHEHQLARACLLQLGAHPLADLRHPHSRALSDAPGKSVDRHLALFSREPPDISLKPRGFSS